MQTQVLSSGAYILQEIESGLSKKFWVECLAALVHVLNVCPTSALVGKTPYEVWNRRKPDISHLRVWGCLAYVHEKDKHAKLGSHMEKCIFIGYPSGYKGWKFYNPETKKVIISERETLMNDLHIRESSCDFREIHMYIYLLWIPYLMNIT